MERLLGPDLTQNNTICTEKAILTACSSDSDGFSIYHDYFKSYAVTHSSANIFASQSRERSEKMCRKSLYNRRNHRRPAFFDYSNHEVILTTVYFFMLLFCTQQIRILMLIFFKILIYRM